ncbi:uncharacterized protein FOMMEDRAFT_19475 [Fomitiporia mediterranea MF3/22]|uniref:uncharacterized protein n=1 Tax=Fomitiporia mediterranea (strain MF3/22) TaxID=694068 RepID=UPI00044072CB|nr:uncharacterized protein FOMMEDRAFT_19475 [Fomitiporia mediterranea MF3/22]EJD04221.1 hypothetical protein FOMMEDRAFT_19475 [Fomitiporia mediterranea MF3/22]
MSRDTLQQMIQPQNIYARCASGGPSYSSDGVAMSSRRLSLNCPNCRASVLNIPEDILEVEEGTFPEPPKVRRWAKRPTFISRPLNRKESDSSTIPGPGSSIRGLDIDGATPKHLRRSSVSSEAASDSSSQTKVEPPPPPRSILTHSPSVSSGKSGKSTLTAKRSVKFCDEPVYYDYSYRFSKFCTCAHPPHHAPFCKLPYDCNGECLYEDYSFCGYDDDMFSFELPEEIPSEARWGVFSRFIAWFRRFTGGRMYTIDAEKRRPVISRPQPLTPRPCRVDVAREKKSQRKMRKRRPNPPRTVYG